MPHMSCILGLFASERPCTAAPRFSAAAPAEPHHRRTHADTHTRPGKRLGRRVMKGCADRQRKQQQLLLGGSSHKGGWWAEEGKGGSSRL